VKGKDEHALDFAVFLAHIFGSGESGPFHWEGYYFMYGSRFLPRKLV
jgi:hypothetical protein